MNHRSIRACQLDLQFAGKTAECVLDYGRPDMCLYAEGLRHREQCPFWDLEASARNEADTQSRATRTDRKVRSSNPGR